MKPSNQLVAWVLGGILSVGCGKEPLALYDKSFEARIYQHAQAGADRDEASAHIYLGWAYATGSGVLRDRTLAVKHLKAAMGRDPEFARSILELFPTNGGSLDMDAAARLVRKESGADNPHAQFIMAMWFALGTGVPVNKTETIRLLQSAERNGSQLAAQALQETRGWK